MNPNTIGWNFSLPSQTEQPGPPPGHLHVLDVGSAWGGNQIPGAPPCQATSSSSSVKPPSIGFVLTPPNGEDDAPSTQQANYPTLAPVKSRLGHVSLNRAHSDVIWSPSSRVPDQGPHKPLSPKQVLITSFSDMAERQKDKQFQQPVEGSRTDSVAAEDHGIAISRSLSLPHREMSSSCPEKRSDEYRAGLKKMANLMTDVDLNEDVMRNLKQRFELHN
ncbi:unnamed protein product [Schistocephalus solidus]|uniref:Neogenin_C domain-containing protein n=1 Tax=Schistocephalus solidus TaxID=70667 RepID=A0A0V0J950_SCHSO|nr:unnamed protein product [Schistocephalus solidus]